MGEISGKRLRSLIAKRDNKVSQTQKIGPSQSISSPVEQILFLQRTIGNQAVGRLIKSGVLQAKLRIGQPGDIYEQEADRVAEQVMRMPNPQVQKGTEVSNRGIGNAIQRLYQKYIKKPHNQPMKINEEKHLQTKGVDNSPEITPELESSINAIRGGGQPLPESVRAFYEPRFEQDFSQVRMHTDAKAAETARAVNARAFTMGNDVVFEKGEYTPETSVGRRLLAHELTHVVQQKPYLNIHQQVLQRDPDKATRKDVVVITSPDVGAEAPVLAPGVKPIRVTSIDELASELKKINYPIKTLYIISHSLPQGDIGFGDRKSLTYVLPSKVASTLKGTLKSENAPEMLDFRGCTIAQSPKAMNEIMAAVGAKAAIGGNCYLITQANGPVILDKIEIRRLSQVTSKNRADFIAGLKKLIDSFGKAKGCIMDTSEQAYFRAGGKLIAQWFSPGLSTEWDERKSKCYKDLRPEKIEPSKAIEGEFDPGIIGNCRLIRIEKKEK